MKEAASQTARHLILDFLFASTGQDKEATIKMPKDYRKILGVKFYSANLPAECKFLDYKIDNDNSKIPSGLKFGALQDIMSQYNTDLAQAVATDQADIYVRLKDEMGSFAAYSVQIILLIDK